MRLRLRAALNVFLLVSAVCGAGLLARDARRPRDGTGGTQNVLYGRTLDGRVRPLRFTGSPTLHLVFSPGCPVSAQAVPSWRALLDDPRLRGSRVVGIGFDEDSVQAVAAFVREHGLGFEVYTVAYHRLGQVTGVRMVPSVILTDREGRMAYVKQGGVVDDAVRDSIAAYVARDTGR